MPALWQVQMVKPTLFSISCGMAVEIIYDEQSRNIWRDVEPFAMGVFTEKASECYMFITGNNLAKWIRRG
jgi:hypothetical protein